ncbi:MAG TPA: polysaccharide biosynthesis C-terminal domain-containing protein [Bacteroidia bacterium]|jgi:O-antigen/teichoic acid export membrane protein|nr:polysaccharide biosynthesis C-terminal domain-containing protein [Bacteroidia bacterium]
MHLFKSILKTVIAKGAGSVISFLIVILTAKLTGAVGRGHISMMVLNITVILLVNDLIGGGALVFLVPRHPLPHLLIPSWFWGIGCGTLFPIFFYLFGSCSRPEYMYLTALSIFLNLSSINSVVLNGKEKIRAGNIIALSQLISLFLLLLVFLLFRHWRTPEAYYLALLISYIISFLMSLTLLWEELHVRVEVNYRRLMRDLIRRGFYVQLGNAVQLLNYRLSFYMLKFFFPLQGDVLVGIYSTGASVGESVWVISNGISLVQYARIANMSNRKDAQELSAGLSKISWLATLGAVLILAVLPASFFGAVFGPEFAPLHHLILLLSAGIAAFGLSCIYSHYFSGIGKMHVSSYSSLVGFAVTVVAGLMLIPAYGIYGAAITACCSYLASALFLLIRFRNECRYPYSFLLFSYKNLFSFIKESSAYVRNQRNH